MATFTAAQLQQLIDAIVPNAQQPQQPPATVNDSNMLNPMAPCILPADKMLQLTRFETWLEEVENRMRFMGITDAQKKLSLLRSWGGEDLVKFMKTHAKVRFEETPAVGTTAAIPADTYDEAVKKIKDEFRKLVNRTMAMYQLMNTKQGDLPWMDYIKILEDKAHALNFDNIRYTHSDAVKHAAIFGMPDDKLQEKSLADDPSFADLVRLGRSRESGKESLHQLNRHITSTTTRTLSRRN